MKRKTSFKVSGKMTFPEKAYALIRHHAGKIAERVSRHEQVEACFLMSGAYDLLVFAKGDSLQDVAQFVAQDLSTIEGVLSTATHFMLRTYKSGGVLGKIGENRMEVS